MSDSLSSGDESPVVDGVASIQGNMLTNVAFALLQPLFISLRRAGFVVDVQDLLEIRKLLTLAPDIWLGELLGIESNDSGQQRWRLLLRPILATSAEQEARFNTLFDSYWPNRLPCPTSQNNQSTERSWYRPMARHIMARILRLAMFGLILSVLLILLLMGREQPGAPSPSPGQKGTPSPPGRSKDGGPTQTSILPFASGVVAISVMAVVVILLVRSHQKIQKSPQKGEEMPPPKPPSLEEYSMLAIQHLLYDWILTDLDMPANPYRHPQRIARLLRTVQALQCGEATPYGRQIDVSRTLDTTLRQAGFVDEPIRVPHHDTPSYIALIERQNFRDQQAALFEMLAEELRRNGVSLVVYTFREHPAVLYTADGCKGIPLSELFGKHATCRLLLFTNGHGLLDLSGADGAGSSLHPALNQALDLNPGAPGWERGLYISLSVRSLGDVGLVGGRIEASTEGRFTAVPATLVGLRIGAQLLNRPAVTNRAWTEEGRKARARRVLREPPCVNSKFPPLPDLPEDNDYGEYLRLLEKHPLFLWIASCAVYRQVVWDLTLHLGTLLESLVCNSQDTEAVNLRLPSPLVTEESLLELMRLPYFSIGEYPAPLRAELVHNLLTQHPYLAQHISAHIMEWLNRPDNVPPADSFAYQRHRLEVLVQRFVQGTLPTVTDLVSLPDALISEHPLLEILIHKIPQNSELYLWWYRLKSHNVKLPVELQYLSAEFDDLMKLAQGIEDPYNKAWTLSAIAAAQAQAGDMEGVRQTLEQARDITETIHYVSSKFSALGAIASAQAQAGDIQGARRTVLTINDISSRSYALRAIAIAQAEAGKIEDLRQTAMIINDLSSKQLVLGAIATAQAQAGDMENARQTALTINDAYSKSLVLSAIASAQAQAGDMKGAQQSLKQARQNIRAIDYAFAKSKALSTFASAQAQAGDMKGAQQSLKQAQLIARIMHDTSSQSSAMSSIAAVQAQIGDMEGAKQNLKQAQQIAQTINSPSSKSFAIRAIATAMAQAGDMEGARATLQSLLDPEERASGLRSVIIAWKKRQVDHEYRTGKTSSDALIPRRH